MAKKVDIDNINESKTFRYFNVMYVMALLAIAMITVISQILVQSFLTNHQNDSHLVRIAGQQSTLSQRLAKGAVLYQQDEYLSPSVDELRELYIEWQKGHRNLLKYNQEDKVIESVGKLLETLESPYQRMNTSAGSLMEEIAKDSIDENKVKRLTAVYLENEVVYLDRMDTIMRIFDEEATEKVRYLKYVEYLVLAIVLVTIIFEVIFIFYPVAKKIKTVISSLIHSESMANNMTQELQLLNKSLEKSNKDVRDITFALNEATILIKTDQHGTIIYTNDKYCKITKYSKEALVGKLVFENTLGGEESIIYEHIRDAKRRYKMWQGEIFDHAKDGTNFWLDVTLIPIISNEGVLYQYLIICSDITKRKLTEAKLAMINKEKFEQQRKEQKIRSFSIISGQEKERKRMAREIHDGVGQMLTALKFGVEAIVSQDEKQKNMIKGIKDLLHQVIQEIRRISSDLLPSVLNDFGLSPAIKDLVQIFNQNSSIQIHFIDEFELDEKKVNKTVQISLYRITQEAVNNALKHAEANQITISLGSDAEFIHLVIEDNGRGFDVGNALIKGESRDSGNGLSSMRERVDLIGGKLTINSTPGKGTIIDVEVPLDDENYGKDQNSIDG